MSNIDLSALITTDMKRERIRLDASAKLAELRWCYETAGVTLADGRQVATTRVSQSQIANAATGVQAGLITQPLPWKTPEGWTEFTPEALLDMASQVSAHVRACFVAERMVSAQLETATDPTAVDLETAFAAALSASLDAVS
jgi:hypothetical protein